MQDLLSSRRPHSGQSCGLSRSRRLARVSPRSSPKSSPKPTPCSPRTSLRTSVGSPRACGANSGNRSPLQRRAGCPPRAPVVRSSTSPSASNDCSRDGSPCVRTVRPRSPTPEMFRRAAMVPSSTGLRAGRLRSPVPSLVPPVVQPTTPALSPVRDRLSRTWSFPGPSRSCEGSPNASARTSPQRYPSDRPVPKSAWQQHGADGLSRSWKFRPGAARCPGGSVSLRANIRNFAEKIECPGRTSGAGTSLTNADALVRSFPRTRVTATSSVNLPVNLPTKTSSNDDPSVAASMGQPLENGVTRHIAKDGSLSLAMQVQRQSRASTPPPSVRRCQFPHGPAFDNKVIVGAALFCAAMRIGSEDVQTHIRSCSEKAEPRCVPRRKQTRSNSPVPLTPSEISTQREGNFNTPPATHFKLSMNVEENMDPNTIDINKDAIKLEEHADEDISAMKPTRALPRKAFREDNNPPQVQNRPTAVTVIVGRGTAQKGAAQKEQVGLSRLPLGSLMDQSVTKPEEIWLRLDALRVRMEMLPGGLVIERDTNLTDVAALMALMQRGEAISKHTEILADCARVVELVEAVEQKYWQWCLDMDAIPLDMPAKQQVYDWLVHDGEKQAVLDQMREVGARRCIGPGNAVEGSMVSGDMSCNKFLQYCLYKSKVRRCPACCKESKRLLAFAATQTARQDFYFIQRPRSSPGTRRKNVVVSECLPLFIPVEARELAFVLHGGCTNMYFRAYVLLSDLEIAKNTGGTVTVNWADGDRRHRSVQPNHVILMDHPWACDVRSASVAFWHKDTQRLTPKI